MAYLVYKRRQAELIKSYLYIQIGNATTYIQLPVLDLHCSTGCYTVDIDRTQTRFVLEDFRLYSTISWKTGVNIMNHILQMPADHSGYKAVPLWTAKRLRSILKGDHYGLLLLLNNRKKLVQLLLLKPILREPPVQLEPPASSDFPGPPCAYPALRKY